jgi:hypothetical protein
MISDTISYALLVCFTIIFTAFALGIEDKMWRVFLKFMAGLFWIILAIAQFYFVGSTGFLLVLSLPFTIFGLIFWFMILNDFLGDKHDRIWNFKED